MDQNHAPLRKIRIQDGSPKDLMLEDYNLKEAHGALGRKSTLRTSTALKSRFLGNGRWLDQVSGNECPSLMEQLEKRERERGFPQRRRAADSLKLRSGSFTCSHKFGK